MTKLLRYALKNILARKITSGLTLFGVALVVFVFAGTLMLSAGLKETLVGTGSDENVIIIRKSSQTEAQSIMPRDAADVIIADPAFAKAADGSPLVARETQVMINIPKFDGDQSNVAVRGVDSKSFELRPLVQLTSGRKWRPGTSEVIVGREVSDRFAGCRMGDKIRFGAREWTVVGIFEAAGAGFESEIWGDAEQMLAAFERSMFSSLTGKVVSVNALALAKSRLEKDPRVTVDVFAEREYYENQSQFTGDFISILGTIISIIFSLGAIVGAMITMYGAVASRTVEIGALRALGFPRSAILTAFLGESVAMSLLGGALGILGALALTLVRVSTTNYGTFSELAFGFHMSSSIAIESLIFAVTMGVLGGFLPAVRAARLGIVQALKGE